jgi:hypothetical protein
MTAKKTEVHWRAALVDRKLVAMEKAKKPLSLSELNATRRLVDWLNSARRLERVRELKVR